MPAGRSGPRGTGNASLGLPAVGPAVGDSADSASEETETFDRLAAWPARRRRLNFTQARAPVETQISFGLPNKQQLNSWKVRRVFETSSTAAAVQCVRPDSVRPAGDPHPTADGRRTRKTKNCHRLKQICVLARQLRRAERAYDTAAACTSPARCTSFPLEHCQHCTSSGAQFVSEGS